MGGGIAAVFLLSSFCLLPSFSQTQPTPTPTPIPAPSPSPSPTPPPNLHQWGAVTSFHGLPSDRTHAIAQTEFGVTWFATDGGLARYDGRRTQSVQVGELANARVLALRIDDAGVLWVGTESGAARLVNGAWQLINETRGKADRVQRQIGKAEKDAADTRLAVAKKTGEVERLADRRQIFTVDVELDEIMTAAKADKDRFSALVMAVVKSDPFQKRKGKRTE